MASSNTTTPSMPEYPLELILQEMNVDLTIGITIVFGLLIAMLYGITSVQTYIYFNSSPRDGVYLKTTIFVLWLIDTLGALFSFYVVYQYCVKALLKPTLWTQILWSDGVNFMFISLSDAIVTVVFAYRIYKLGGKVWPLLFILPPAALVFVGGQAMGITTFLVPSFAELRQRISWLFYTVFSLQAFSDIAIMVSICTILLRHRRSRIQRTRSVVGMLIFYSVNTCLLTCSVGAAALLSNALSPNTFFWQGLSATLPKLMLNSLLALLNSRENMRTKLNHEAPLSIHLTSVEPRFQFRGRARTGSMVESSEGCGSVIECVAARVEPGCPLKAKVGLDVMGVESLKNEMV